MDGQADVTIFGGTGFLGSRIATFLVDRGACVRIAARRPHRIREPAKGLGKLDAVEADINQASSVAAAVRGSRAVVNAVSLYLETRKATFRSVHVEGAQQLAAIAREEGVRRLLHISGLGAHPAAPSRYERCRGEGESAVVHAFPEATIFRPGVMFGPGDSFLTNLVRLLRIMPVFPLFGTGMTRLQPVFVDDVAQAAANVLTEPGAADRIYELAGPKVYTYSSLLEMIMDTTGRRTALVPFPYIGWKGVAAIAGLLPSPPITHSQVALMEHDNVASPDLPGLKELGVRPTSLESVLRAHFVK